MIYINLTWTSTNQKESFFVFQFLSKSSFPLMGTCQISPQGQNSQISISLWVHVVPNKKTCPLLLIPPHTISTTDAYQPAISDVDLVISW